MLYELGQQRPEAPGVGASVEDLAGDVKQVVDDKERLKGPDPLSRPEKRLGLVLQPHQPRLDVSEAGGLCLAGLSASSNRTCTLMTCFCKLIVYTFG